MVTRVTGAPAIQEPRASVSGGPSVDLRSTQVAIQNIRERFRLLELALNNLVVPDSTSSSSSTSSGNAGGPPGAIQFTDAGGGFAGSLSLTWSATNQELSIVGDTYFYGDLYQNGTLLTFVTGIYADGVEHIGLVNMVAGSGITIAALTGNVIEISSAASAGVNSLNTLQGNVTLQGDGSVTVTVLTGNVIELSASASAGVSSLNLLTGPVTIQGDGSVTVSILTGNVIEISSSASGGVSSLNSFTGDVTLQAGTNVTITPLTGNVIEISASGSGSGVSSLNTLTGPVTIQGDGTVNVSLLSGNVIELSAAASSGVTSLNYLTGPVTIRGEGGIQVGFGTGNVIELRGTLFSTGGAPPSGALPGDRWVQNDTGIMFTYYDDGNTSQWVDFSNVSSGGGSEVVYPISIALGGTGSETAADAINALLPSQTGNSGEVLTTNGTVASWAALSSLGLTFSDYTPADASGGAVSFTAADGRYVKIGKMVWFWANVTYPVTGDTSNAAITLPSTVGASINIGITIAQSSVTAAKGAIALAGYAYFFVYGELIRTNADLSGATLFITGFYEEA